MVRGGFMRFFLVGRHRESGDVRIVSERTYATRQEALDSLSTVQQADLSFVDSDLFVVDLEAVTPVVVYRPAAPAEPAVPAEEPIADAWEAPAEEPIDEALSAGLLEPVDEAMDSVAVARAGDDGLAEALRRAASRMEAEGIQPAATVEELIAAQTVDAAAPEPVAEDVALEEAPAAEAAAVEPPVADGVAEAPADGDLSGELLSVADLPAPEPVAAEPLDARATSWPWEASAEAAAPGVVEPASELFRPSGIEEPATVTSDMLPTPADDFMPRPVIMGDYGQRDDFVTIEEAEVPEAPAAGAEPAAGSVPASLEDLGIPSEWLEDAESAVEVAGSESAEPAPADEPVDDTLTSLGPAAASDADVPAYQPASIDMDAYACEDCVYAGTCPKAGQDRPATCGSFQWKSM